MSVRGWFSARPWWVKAPLGLVGILVLGSLLYVAGRSLQFVAAEKEAGLYLPVTANVVVRAKGLGRHLDRLESTGAWRAIRLHILKDPSIRPAINRALKDAGAPTLDELWDERNRDVYSVDLLMRGAGRDAAVALQVGEGWSPLRWFAVTRVRWSDYLLLPFARLVFPAEKMDESTVLRLPGGKPEMLLAFEGRLALASNDRVLLREGLLRKGNESPEDRPVTARVDFGTSRALLSVRGSLRDSGALSQIRMDSVRAIEVGVDLEGMAARLDIGFEGAEVTHPDAPAPHALLRLAPPGATGAVASSTGPQDLFEWLRSFIHSLGPNDPLGRNVREALESLDEVGFSSEFLPNLDGGMAVLTGAEDGERDNRVYPAVALIIPSRDPIRAVEALCHVVRTRAGPLAEKKFTSVLVGDVPLWSFSWWESGQVNDFFRPCFAAIPGAFVFGNNLRFTRAVLEEAARGGTDATSGVPLKKLLENGIAPEPALAGGHLLLPALRESLDGPIPRVASYLVTATVNFPQFRAQLDAELREERRVLTAKQVEDLFKERIARLERGKEDELRASLHALDFMKWAAFSLQPAGKGATLRAAIEFK
jgi:hypothetical protein